MAIAKVQHYVPQFLLRNFGNGKKDQVWVYDKSSARAFPSNTKNVASESRFYDFEYQGQTISLEPWLSQLEGNAQSVIRSILEADSLATLTNEQRQILAAFLAVQLTRTKTFREQWDALPRLLREHLQRNGDQVAAGSQAEELIRDIPPNDLKEQAARVIYKAPETYASQFLNKDWVLAATTRKAPFLLSDNPLTRQNMVDRPGRGNLGLALPGIEIYFPLSPTRALAMWCPTLTETVHRGALTLMSRNGSTATVHDPNGIIRMSDALLNGDPVLYSPENVENFNSLQIIWSERYIFSSANDFQLAQTMLSKHPSLKKGPRPATA
ncbi:DUF4238 domain-containing protein [Roseateles sp. DAIF2]|uniref:DUF4238 domain-containing protein n=1 Tax=Roseateles sp. DAIF2 TaxID=2714952 RepID=UPI0018A25514|nr:DUF4238 domain-containing protein [Roseateles sp. DAIF2]QPF76186.1 DUF4238 domain-containing protein [Roseateles sp. DAIF2]